MSAAKPAGTAELVDEFQEFFRNYYDEEIRELAQHYPNEQRSLEVDWEDIFRYDPDLADDYLNQPDQLQRYAEEALRLYDLPIDVSLGNAHVRVYNLNAEDSFYPGWFSPTDRHDNTPYLTLEGQIEKATDVDPKVEEAAFECQLCGSITRVPQSNTGDDFQEPHECQGCERQGPFQINFDQSEFVDAQLLRLAEPPEVVAGGDGTKMDVTLEDDLTDVVEPGDRVDVTGRLRLKQDGSNNNKSARFKPYLEGHHIEVSDTDFEDLQISEEDKRKIEAIANGEYGPLFEVVTGSIAPDLTGEKYVTIKECIFLMLIGGATVELENGREVRGVFHMLLIGDASTGKSTLLREAKAIAPRSVFANGKGATEAGMTATAKQDDWADGEWTLDAGALVQANNGLACVDEIDKVREDVQDSMHGAMADMKVDINKGGINTTLPAETSVFAGGNPKHSRWDDYVADSEQIELSETLLSRFALIWKLQDIPDKETDREKAEHVLDTKEAAKAKRAGEATDVDDDDRIIDHDLLRKYVAYARQLPDPRFRDKEMRNKLRDAYVRMRGTHGYDEDAPVPITLRKLQDMHRLAEASARARLSEWIEEEDIKRAKRLVGESLQDYGMNEDGEFDADIVEANTSKPQRDRIKNVEAVIKELQKGRSGGVPYEEIFEKLEETGISRDKAEHEIEKLKQKGKAYEPTSGKEVRLT
ncbi:minichromosome maintenance protein MCM [Natronolimnohabitans sp. A-GB9]|uniref:minichromosome maintenance protein MCM n=1 Tax=Natronolimnohabitans sp. A-GB9 TaxID=3069757 RepID=UPI0027B062E2|nr:minichromosome maintenance protein MCM [Natronolimnohabitans sp. A-GB9]MDQ2052948.1 minichromosome maintenance protein MCM [Natronolimnohabitans sp. A-GB9]